MVKIWTSNARGVGSIPDQGTKIPHAAWCGQKKKKRKKAKKERDREESEALAEKREQNSVFFSETGGRKD